MSKVISRIVIEPSAELKAILDDFKQTASDVIAACAKTHNPHQPTGALLDTMQDAANDSLADAVQSASRVAKQGLADWRARNAKPRNLGQWIFEGQDEKWISASVDRNGTPVLHTARICELENDLGQWYSDGQYLILQHLTLNADNWLDSPIDREPVNDVDYLSDDKQQIDEIALDDQRTRLLAESVPHVTPKDLQSIFINGLADLLIQRMHSQDRFSEEDYAIGGDKLEAWDIVFEPLTSIFGLFTGKHEYQKIGSFLFFTNPSKTVVDWDMATAAFTKTRTITESEMKDFREVLEACYV